MSYLSSLLIGVLGYILAKSLRLPAPGMLGSLFLVGIYSSLCNPTPLPSTVKVFTQAISGAYIGMQVKKHDLLNLKSLFKPIILLLVLLTVNTFVVGYLLYSISDLSLVTSLLSCVPGGISDIPLISLDMGADSSVVAIMQLTRLVVVLMVFPFLIKHVDTDGCETTEQITNSENSDKEITKVDFIKSPFIKQIFTITIAIIASLIGYWLKITSGPLVFSLIFVSVFSCSSNCAFISKKFKIIAQICAGTLIGTTINSSTILGLSNIIIPSLILIISYFIINFLYSSICSKLKWLDMKSAMFASCPAGASDMALIASELGGDMKKIALIQVIRLIFAVAVIPQLISFFIFLLDI